ncbi:arginine--tRNA ligase [soil metagenome]
MIKEKLAEIVQQAFSAACLDGAMGPLKSSADCAVAVVIEKPKSADHGDFACGMALKLASHAKFAPLKIAETLAQYITKSDAYLAYLDKVEVAAPGFINFTLGRAWLTETISQVHNLGADYGRSADNGKKVLVEYVSANPTGELHIGHGRNAVFGSCLANLMKFGGYHVDQEFYINDYGEQILQLGRCTWALYQRIQGQAVDYPTGGYPEEFLRDFVQTVVNNVGDKYLKLSDEEGSSVVGDLVKDLIIDNQRSLLKSIGIEFDLWYSERSLHEGVDSKVAEVLKEFDKHGFTYENDGAYWLKAQELGDERDRVLRKSSGATTYLANDAAYHLTKYGRGYDLMINIWGADHHGQVPGLKGAVRALGQDPSKLEVILTQMVNLCRDGQIVKMSKRAGTVIMLSEVVEEVGADATRYYLAESSPQNSINFDLDLAKKTGRENPAFYIQYAHARCCAILRKALEPSTNSESGQTEQAPISPQQWQEFLQEYKADKEGKVFAALFDPDATIAGHQKALIARLEAFPAEVEEAVQARNPGRIARYAYDLANDLQKFYEVSRVITDQLSVSKARLGLIFATKQVLANALGIIGVSAPERM